MWAIVPARHSLTLIVSIVSVRINTTVTTATLHSQTGTMSEAVDAVTLMRRTPGPIIDANPVATTAGIVVANDAEASVDAPADAQDVIGVDAQDVIGVALEKPDDVLVESMEPVQPAVPSGTVQSEATSATDDAGGEDAWPWVNDMTQVSHAVSSLDDERAALAAQVSAYVALLAAIPFDIRRTLLPPSMNAALAAGVAPSLSQLERATARLRKAAASTPDPAQPTAFGAAAASTSALAVAQAPYDDSSTTALELQALQQTQSLLQQAQPTGSGGLLSPELSPEVAQELSPESAHELAPEAVHELAPEPAGEDGPSPLAEAPENAVESEPENSFAESQKDVSAAAAPASLVIVTDTVTDDVQGGGTSGLANVTYEDDSDSDETDTGSAVHLPVADVTAPTTEQREPQHAPTAADLIDELLRHTPAEP